MNKVAKSIFTFLLLITVTTGFGQIQNQLIKFNRLLRLVDSFYADSTDMEKLTETAIISLLGELDPHSVYISKEDVKKMNEPLEGSFEGIGISFNILRDTLMVVQTIPGGPSEKVGLQAGDRIIFIDDENVAGIGLTNQMVFDRLKGKKGTLVTIKVLRKDESGILEFEIIRDKIPIYSLDAAYMLDKNTAYVKLNRFAASTAQEFIQALTELQNDNTVNNLVLDLRSNGGGYLTQAFEISDQFLEANKSIVYTEGLKSSRKDYTASDEGIFKNGKIAILIDRGTASASEIVSGSVQDWDRGIIIGRRSFGKGLVQNQYPLTDGSMIRLTTAHYYTPSGRCIQRPYDKGVAEYRQDIYERMTHGELLNKDSIHIDESEVFQTLINKRTVYGGGGIIPDVFVPIDTSVNYQYYNKLIRKGIFNKYALNYVDDNRHQLEKTYPSFEKYKANFHVSDKMLETIWKAGEDKGIERDEKSIKTLNDKISEYIKALIARNLWKQSEFYEIVNKDDIEILKAIEILNDEKQYNSILKNN